jgi:putative ABC transport system permease protein
MIRISYVPLRLALRNLRQGVRGFGIFLACIVLGVTTIVGIDSLSHSLTDGLASEGRNIIGADISVSRMHRPATESEKVIFSKMGKVSEMSSLRGMAVSEQGAALVDLKAVDTFYPAIGAITLDPPQPLNEALLERDGAFGAVADLALFSRLNLKPGAVITLGDAKIRLSAVLVSEPDRIGSGITLGPRVILSPAALAASGLVQPGSLVRYNYRIVILDGQNDDRAVREGTTELTASLADGGFEIRSRLNASPQLSKNIERFTQFLTFVGLTALLVGGTGVANAVSAYLDRRRNSMAILKALGASGTTVFAIAFFEIMGLASLGVLIGLMLGAALPFAVAAFAGPLLPFPLEPHVYGNQLIIGAVYGLLTAITFSLGPLGRVHDIPVAALFRDAIMDDKSWPRLRYLAGVIGAAMALSGAVIFFSFDRFIALMAVAGTLIAFLILRLVAKAIMALAKHMSRPRRTEFRLALSNIYRPGALTPSLVLSLGLGVTLLVAISLIDANISRQLTKSLPERAPSFFFVDIPGRDLERFDGFLRAAAGDATIVHVPMLRGRITELKGIKAEKAKSSEDASWVLEGDRGITFSDHIPDGSTLVAGEWWPKDYKGTPLVSLEADIAKGLGIGLGDQISVNVLGRTLSATVSNLRRVDWQSLGINFVLVFSPNTFAGAPVSYLATLTLKDGSDAKTEADVLNQSAKAYPAITAIRVKEALEAISELVGKLVLGIRGASGITILAGILVLAGALGAGQRNRIRDAVILKTLGATRWRLLLAYCIEYGLIGFAAALFGLLAGTGAAYAIVTFAMKTGLIFVPIPAIGTMIVAVATTILIGLIGTWRVLDEKPSAHLKGQ